MPAGDQRRVRGLSVVVTDERGLPVSAGGLARWLRNVAPARVRGAVGVAVVSDARVRTLNRTYRGRDYATDVLSFPAEPSHGLRSNPKPLIPNPQSLIPNPYLGDIVIARGVARRQAREVGHDEPTELRVLALHGLLHLLGYDHERDRGTMARAERRMRRRGGLAEGLLDRVDRRPAQRRTKR